MKDGIGARLPRKEDDRFLRGRGQYVGDVRLPGMQEVAFLRSPLAHARIKDVRVPPAIRERVFIAENLVSVAPIRADTALPGFKSSQQPVLATGKVRYVGELVAMCVANTRAEAEDMAAEIELELEPLPALTDMLAARRAESALVHEHWGDNLFLTTDTEVDFEALKRKAALTVTRELRTARQAMSPLEGRAVIAAAASATRASCCPRRWRSPGPRAAWACLCAGSKIAARVWRPTPTAANTIMF
jgi:carbon-monoxide dehydrogenase large subunit